MRMSVHVARTVPDVAELIECGKNGFVKFPLEAYGKKPLSDDMFDMTCWQPCKKVRSFDDVVGLVRICPSTQRTYSWDQNNCQHFASHLYHERGGKLGRGRKRGVGTRRHKVPCAV